MSLELEDEPFDVEVVAQQPQDNEESEEDEEAEKSEDHSSLPVAEAFPETIRRNSVTAFTAAVRYVKDIYLKQDPVVIDVKTERRPAMISIRFLKETADQRFGLSFVSNKGELVFGTIAPTGLLAQSSVRVGDRLLSIDHHHPVTHWTGEQAAGYLRGRMGGYISMVVNTKNGSDPNTVEACVYKSEAGLKLGLSFYNDQGRLRILRITSHGLLGGLSVLQANDFVERINSTEAEYMDATAAHELLNRTVGLVSVRTKKSDKRLLSLRDIQMSEQLSSQRLSEHVVAADELDVMESGDLFLEDDVGDLPRPRFISVTVQKPTVDTVLGLSFANPTESQLILSKIQPQGLLARSPLRAGCLLHSINGISIQNYTRFGVTELVRTLAGTIQIVAEDPMGDVTYAVAMAFKSTPRANLYLSFHVAEGGALALSRIGLDSFLNNSVLNVHDKIIAINKIPCDHVQPEEAVEITQRNPESVTILVRVGRKNVIVLSHAKGVPVTQDNSCVQREGECVCCKTCLCISIVFIGIIVFFEVLG